MVAIESAMDGTRVLGFVKVSDQLDDSTDPVHSSTTPFFFFFLSSSLPDQGHRIVRAASGRER